MNKLPSWANCKVQNIKTGEIIPAFDNDQTWELYDENGQMLGREWVIHLTRADKIRFIIAVGIAACGVLIAAILYFFLR